MKHNIKAIWGSMLCMLLCAFAGTAMAASSGDYAKKIDDDNWWIGDPISFYDGRVKFDAQIRHRFEVRNNWIDFNERIDQRDDAALMQRLRLGLQLKPVDGITVYAQLQDSRTFFDEPKGPAAPTNNREFVVNDSPIDLRQAYVKFGGIGDLPLSLTVGRQILSYGDQRLVGGFEWDNNARTFDAVKLSYANDVTKVDYFAGYVVRHETADFNTSDSEDLFTGIHATTKAVDRFKLDGYVYYRSKSDVDTSTVFANLVDQSSGNTAPAGDYFTFGTWIRSDKDAFGPWDFAAHIAGQAGEVSAPLGLTPAGLGAGFPINNTRQDLLAFASHVEVGYTFKSLAWKPRVFAQYDFATGDDNPNDGTSNTFQNLFPTNHLYYGYMDRFSWQNMHHFGTGINFKPTDKLSVKVHGHMFWLDETTDAWRFAGQGAVGGAPRYGNALASGPGNFVGSEIDIVANYNVTKWFSVQTGYSHFFAGEYIKETSPTLGGRAGSDDADFFYFQTLLKF